MRKLILQMQMSADGFIGRTGLEPDWQVWDWGARCAWDAKLCARFNRFFRDADTILLSRKMMDGGYLEHWAKIAKAHPETQSFAFARKVLTMRKVIFSKKNRSVSWPSGELARRALATEVKMLKRERGKNLVAFGGAGFARELLRYGLVDEIEFYLNPYALGHGLSLFRDFRKGLKLKPP